MANTKITAANIDSTSTGITFADLTVNGDITGTLATAAQPNITSLGTLTALTVDNITFNGAEIDSNTNLLIDSAGYIEIDADTNGNIYLNDNAVGYGQLSGANGDFTISSAASDKDIIFKGNDGGSTITALTLDMSDAGAATFNSTITTGGNITIGNTSLSQTILQFLSATNGANTIHFGDGASADAYRGYINYNHTGDRMEFATSGTERVRIDSSGNVGIGMTSPQRKFEVSTANAEMSHFGQIAATNGHYTGITLGYREDNTNYRKAGIIQEQIGDGAARGHLHLCVDTGADNNSINPADSKLMIHGTSGNVGIGTSSPAFENGNGLEIRNAGGNGAHLKLTDAASGTGASQGFDLYMFNSQGYIENYENAPIIFRQNGGESARFDASGNVGIGMTPASGGSDTVLSLYNSATPRFRLHNSTTGTTASDGGEINMSGSDFILENREAGNVRFFCNNGERMRIDSSGRLMVNQTSASAASAGGKMQVAADVLSTGSLAGFFWENRSGMTIASQSGWGGWYSTSTASHFLYSDGANRASIGRTSGTYTALSDVNKKKDFEDSTVGLAEVMQLKPKKFRMLDDADDSPKKLGFIAQDVENVIPEAYVEDTNEDASGVENTFIGLTDRPIIAALTKAIQEQQTIIDDLKSRIETLEG